MTTTGIHDALLEVIAGCTDDASRVDEVLALLEAEDYHGSGGCPACDRFHCPDESDHDRGEVDQALQSLHAQAHNGPKDSLYVENCRREGCRDAA